MKTGGQVTGGEGDPLRTLEVEGGWVGKEGAGSPWRYPEAQAEKGLIKYGDQQDLGG